MTKTDQAKERYDVVIVGAGPAGLTAGMYAARQGMTTAIVAGEVGGQASWAKKIENYMGWQVITGPELVARFRDHMSAFDVDCFEGQLVNAVVPIDGGFEIYTREGAKLVARAVIIAAGRAPNRLAVPGEADLVGRGVSYCATCDGAFFAGKAVAVVGPGESAADASLQLAALGADVTLISGAPVKAPQVLLDKIDADPRITVRSRTKVVRIEGTDKVTGLTVRQLGADTAEETLALEGVFIETGSIAAAEFTGGLVDTNERGEIIVDETGATSMPGIYAAGDVTNGLGKQVIIAAGAGARAAIAADHDLNRR